MGVYKRGTDREIDLAIDLHPHLTAYLAQHMKEAVGFEQSLKELAQIFHHYDQQQVS